VTSSGQLPAELRERVLAASMSSRDAGTPTPPAPVITAAEAFARAAGSLLLLLTDLSDEQWHVPALRDLDVQGLAGHLIGVERDVQRALRGDPDVADADHVVSTQIGVEAQVGVSPARTRAELRRAVDDSLEMVRAARDDGAVLCMHGMRLSRHDLLVVRAFELWTHENDVRRALSLPVVAPDPATLALMTQLAVHLLPHAARRGGQIRESVDIRLVLTGAGGGTWDLRLGRPEGAAGELLMVTDAVDFCHVGAARLAPRELDVHVSGAQRHADEVLTAAASLALD
jgi:uncharacterized protein (TIGR03083 family)